MVDINHLPLDKIEPLPDGGLKIGATVRNCDWPTTRLCSATTRCCRKRSSPGHRRSFATWPRPAGISCSERDACTSVILRQPCNKREPGTGCSAIGGANRTLAILGTSEHCIATNPSDMNVAMAALEATIHVRGTNGERSIRIADFFLLPGTTPQRETVVEPGDLITHVRCPRRRREAGRCISSCAIARPMNSRWRRLRSS